MTNSRANFEKLWRDLRSLQVRRGLLDQAIQSLEAVQQMRQARVVFAAEPATVEPRPSLSRVVRRATPRYSPMARRLSRGSNFRQHF